MSVVHNVALAPWELEFVSNLRAGRINSEALCWEIIKGAALQGEPLPVQYAQPYHRKFYDYMVNNLDLTMAQRPSVEVRRKVDIFSWKDDQRNHAIVLEYVDANNKKIVKYLTGHGYEMGFSSSGMPRLFTREAAERLLLSDEAFNVRNKYDGGSSMPPGALWSGLDINIAKSEECGTVSICELTATTVKQWTVIDRSLEKSIKKSEPRKPKEGEMLYSLADGRGTFVCTTMNGFVLRRTDGQLEEIENDGPMVWNDNAQQWEFGDLDRK